MLPSSDRPLVSVVMPAYNASRFVRAAVESALAQTYPHIEIIVVDDGSTDDTACIVERVSRRNPRVRLLRQGNAGVAGARNRAIAEARGELIAPLDADDLWYRDKVNRQVQRLIEAGPAAGLVYCACVRIDPEGRAIRAGQRWRVEGRVLEPLLMMNFIENASIPLMRRACIEEVGGYNELRRRQGGQGCEDWELSLRIAEKYDVVAVSDYLVAYRLVPGSLSSDASAMGRGHELLLAEIARRHPHLPPEVFRWSRSHFSLYLAHLTSQSGHGREARRWLAEAVRVDPKAALSPWALKTLVRSAARRRQDSGRAMRSSAEPPAQPPRRADVVDPPPLWKPWMPYDRLCRSRWQGVTRRARAFPRAGRDDAAGA